MADVLLVDDNGSVLLTLAIALRRYGHAVTVAGDARQALNQLQRHRFAFLVSDVRMAGMSGIELATQARQLAHPPRIILMSAYSNIEAHEGLAEAFLRKPIDIQELHALLCDQVAGNSSCKITCRVRSEENSPSMASSATQQGSSPANLHAKTEHNGTAHGAARDTSAKRPPRALYNIVFG